MDRGDRNELLSGRIGRHDGDRTRFDAADWIVRGAHLYARAPPEGVADPFTRCTERYRGPYTHCEVGFACIERSTGVHADWAFQVSAATPVVPVRDKTHPAQVWASAPMPASDRILRGAFERMARAIGTPFNGNALMTHFIGWYLPCACCVRPFGEPTRITCSELVARAFREWEPFAGVDALFSSPTQLLCLARRAGARGRAPAG